MPAHHFNQAMLTKAIPKPELKGRMHRVAGFVKITKKHLTRHSKMAVLVLLGSKYFLRRLSKPKAKHKKKHLTRSSFRSLDIRKANRKQHTNSPRKRPKSRPVWPHPPGQPTRLARRLRAPLVDRGTGGSKKTPNQV